MSASQGHSGAGWRYFLLWLAMLDAVALVFGPVWLRPVGFATGGLILYCTALLVLDPLRGQRPPAWVVRSSASLAMVAVPVWVASLVVVVDYATAPQAYWPFGHGAIAQFRFAGTSGAACPPGADAPTKYFFSKLPATTPLRQLVAVARSRWLIEQSYQQMKGELGLDHFEGRSWRGWHHHVTLVFLAWAFLQSRRGGRNKGRNPRRSRRPAGRCNICCSAGKGCASLAAGHSTTA